MPVSILHTKLAVPRLKPALVRRPHLTEALTAACTRGVRLLLISAPAGYGKTTLVGEWLQERPEQAGWFSLDAEDNDPLRFWSYFVGALAEVLPELQTTTSQYLKAPPPLPARGLVIHILNEVAALEQQAVLVLDDYHLINNQAIHDEIAFFLDHLPPGFQLMLVTRADPPLPVARLHARGHALSLRAADLRFSEGEVTALLNEVKALALAPEQVTALETRTEGWAAGLEMAALALEGIIRSKGREGVAAFVDDFSGMQRYILDYLLEEILTRQPARVQAFLLQTSILDRFSASLCAAVVAPESKEAASPLNTAWSLLDYLERANLFLLPLDQDGEWYRYHHLFADLLQARLQRQWPERIPELHWRAARWHETQGLVGEAIGHALKAGEVDLAARLLEQHTRPLLVRGEMHSLLRWIQALPEEVSRRRPWLAVYQAWALTLAGHYQRALALIEPAEAHPTADAPGTDQELQGHRAAIRAFQGATTGREEEGLVQARTALALLPEDALWPRGLAEWSLGYARRARGELEAAVPHFAEVIRIGQRQNDLQAIASAQYDLALIRRRQGRLREAISLLEAIIILAEEQGAGDLGYLGRPEAGLASAYYAQNNLQEARRHLERSQELNERWHNPNHDIRTHLAQARLEIGEGHLAAATAALEDAMAVAREFAVVPFLRERAATLQGLLWLRQGDLAAATRWLGERGWSARALAEAIDSGNEEIDFAEGLEAVLVALRIHLDLADATASGRFVPAITAGPLPAPDEILGAVQEALAALLARSRAAGQGEIALSLLLLQALTCRSQIDEAGALVAVEEALAIAAPEGYMRAFVDEGKSMEELLQACRPRLAGNELLHRYAGRLLTAFPATAADEAREAQPLVEPLTERELEVLALLAEGLTNREIGQTLVIARGTVKAHAASIYGKLDVHNRTSAVARARELGLL